MAFTFVVKGCGGYVERVAHVCPLVGRLLLIQTFRLSRARVRACRVVSRRKVDYNAVNRLIVCFSPICRTLHNPHRACLAAACQSPVNDTLINQGWTGINYTR